MKRFYFSMEKILDLRRFEQDQAELELGKANGEVMRLQRKLDEIAQKKVSTIKNFGNEIDFSIQMSIESFFFMLDQKKEKFLEEIAQARLVADEKREIVRECMKKTKVLEKLREKKLIEWKKNQQKQEDLSVDDIVTAKGNTVV